MRRWRIGRTGGDAGLRLATAVCSLASFLVLGGPKVASAARPSPAEAPGAAAPQDSGAPSDVRLLPSKAGRFGAWLVLGPFRSATSRDRVRARGSRALTEPPLDAPDEATLAPRVGAAWGPPLVRGRGDGPSWALAASGEGPIDVKSALRATDPDLVAYLAGTLHIEESGRYYFLVSADDGVRVLVDGKPVLTRDDPRPYREDADLVPLDLTAGDHPVLVKLHQREGDWLFRARLVTPTFQPPRGSFLTLPGTTPDDARALAMRMSWVSHDRGVFGGGYLPRATVRFPEGAPGGVPLTVLSRVARKGTAPEGPSLLAARGEVPAVDGVVGELVLPLGSALGDDAARLEGTDAVFETVVAGRVVSSPFPARRATREAIGRATAVLGHIVEAGRTNAFATGVVESVAHLRNRLVRLVGRGDTDLEAQANEARELDAAARALESSKDPFAARTGFVRRALVAAADGDLSEVALYVPPSYRPGNGKRYPLVVALHGLNGLPMAMLRWFFGGDDLARDQSWEDRHTEGLGQLEAFVVAPSGHGNATYRALGEDDAVAALDWVLATYPIDRNRITVTGPSMGGIGTGILAFHYPDRFAGAAPLCGYHSYFVRGDIRGRWLRPWERFLAEERSNALWAWNGKYLPLYVVHGTQDQPEANSGVLIERYEELQYSIRHEHPNLGHNVWSVTYDGLKGAEWLLEQRREEHPRHVRFRTARLRYPRSYWVRVDELEAPGVWGEVEAKVRGRNLVEAKTSGVSVLTLDRDPALLDPKGTVTALLDGTRVVVPAGEALTFHKEGRRWIAGPPPTPATDTPRKRGALTGPLRDVFHGPLVFVYGAEDPSHARINEEVARAWASVKPGVHVRYPVMSDAEFLARGEPLDAARSLFLVGNAKENRVLRALEDALPIRFDGEAVVVGASRYTGPHLGAAFVYPNPKRPDRYVAVVEGTSPLATFRSLSLPELLPDFIVYDEAVAPAQGGVVLGAGQARAAGFFRNDWSLPPKLEDPFGRGRSHPDAAATSAAPPPQQ